MTESDNHVLITPEAFENLVKQVEPKAAVSYHLPEPWSGSVMTPVIDLPGIVSRELSEQQAIEWLALSWHESSGSDVEHTEPSCPEECQSVARSLYEAMTENSLRINHRRER